MRSFTPIAAILFLIGCTNISVLDVRANEPITLLGTIVKWRYPDAEIGKSEISDAATTDASGKRTVPSSVMMTTMMTDDSVEKVIAFYKDLLARSSQSDAKIGIDGKSGASVIISDDSNGRQIDFRTILVNGHNTSTVLIITRATGESKTHITWKQYLKHGIGE